MIEMKCPNCFRELKIKDKYAGQTGRCNLCGKPLTVPMRQYTEWYGYRSLASYTWMFLLSFFIGLPNLMIGTLKLIYYWYELEMLLYGSFLFFLHSIPLVLSIAWIILSCKNTQYRVIDGNAYITTGAFIRKNRAIKLADVYSVDSCVYPLERLFGIGTIVLIIGSAGGASVKIKGIKGFEQIQHHIEEASSIAKLLQHDHSISVRNQLGSFPVPGARKS